MKVLYLIVGVTCCALFLMPVILMQNITPENPTSYITMLLVCAIGFLYGADKITNSFQE